LGLLRGMRARTFVETLILQRRSEDWCLGGLGAPGRWDQRGDLGIYAWEGGVVPLADEIEEG